MTHHPDSLWGIVKRAVADIEELNGIKFGNESWKIFKRMDSEILAWERRANAHLRADNTKHQGFDRIAYSGKLELRHKAADDGFAYCGKALKTGVTWGADEQIPKCQKCLKALHRLQEMADV